LDWLDRQCRHISLLAYGEVLPTVYRKQVRPRMLHYILSTLHHLTRRLAHCISVITRRQYVPLHGCRLQAKYEASKKARRRSLAQSKPALGSAQRSGKLAKLQSRIQIRGLTPVRVSLQSTTDRSLHITRLRNKDIWLRHRMLDARKRIIKDLCQSSHLNCTQASPSCDYHTALKHFPRVTAIPPSAAAVAADNPWPDAACNIGWVEGSVSGAIYSVAGTINSFHRGYS
jgi:hypothetical protein